MRIPELKRDEVHHIEWEHFSLTMSLGWQEHLLGADIIENNYYLLWFSPFTWVSNVRLSCPHRGITGEVKSFVCCSVHFKHPENLISQKVPVTRQHDTLQLQSPPSIFFCAIFVENKIPKAELQKLDLKLYYYKQTTELHPLPFLQNRNSRTAMLLKDLNNRSHLRIRSDLVPCFLTRIKEPGKR